VSPSSSGSPSNPGDSADIELQATWHRAASLATVCLRHAGDPSLIELAFLPPNRASRCFAAVPHLGLPKRFVLPRFRLLHYRDTSHVSKLCSLARAPYAAYVVLCQKL
jgi:hypothetical protein